MAMKVQIIQFEARVGEKGESEECSHYLWSIPRVTNCQFSSSHCKTSLNSLTESRATIQTKSGVLGKWSESVVSSSKTGSFVMRIHPRERWFGGKKGINIMPAKRVVTLWTPEFSVCRLVCLVCMWDVYVWHQTVAGAISIWLTDLTDFFAVFQLFVMWMIMLLYDYTPYCINEKCCFNCFT